MVDEIVGIVVYGLEWGVSITLIIGVMAWGARSVIGLIRLTSNA